MAGVVVVIPTLAVSTLLLACTAGAAAAAGATAQEPPTFAAAVEVVYLDVFVTRSGKPVRDLKAENFEIRDDGVAQRARLVDLEALPIGVILAFDTSASLEGQGLRDLRDAGRAVLDGLREGDRAALITFDYSPRLRVGLTSDVARVRRELEAIEARGNTTLYDGLYAALALPGDESRKLVVVFTDGYDTASWLEADQVLDAAERSDAVIQVVAVEAPGTGRSTGFWQRRADPGADNRGPPSRWLERLAQSTGGLYWPTASTDRLATTFLSILEDMATRYVLAFEPEGVKRGGVHEIEVKLVGAKGDVRARKQYVGRSLPAQGDASSGDDEP